MSVFLEEKNKLERILNIKFTKKQLRLAEKLIKGISYELGTGDGKTFAILLASCVLVRNGRNVVVVTSNSALAERDYELYKQVLGIEFELGLLINAQDQTKISEFNILIAEASALVFNDILYSNHSYDVCIIDEMDFILIESALHNFTVGFWNSDKYITYGNLFKNLIDSIESKVNVRVCKNFESDELHLIESVSKDYHVLCTKKFTLLTDLFHAEILPLMETITGIQYLNNEGLYITLLSFIKEYYNSCNYMIKGEHYIVEDGKVILLHAYNSRRMDSVKLDIKILLGLYIKENLDVNTLNENSYGVKSSFFRYFNKYKHLVGTSGSLLEAKGEIRELYGIEVQGKRIPNKRVTYSIDFLDDKFGLYRKIASILDENKKSAVLIICDNESEVFAIYNTIKHINNFRVSYLTNSNLEDEIVIINSAGNESTITISTNILGRGTDIKATNSADEVVLIYVNAFFSKRIDRQILGRVGRQGSSAKIYRLLSADTKLFEFLSGDEFVRLSGKNSMQYLRKVQEQREEYFRQLRGGKYLADWYVNGINGYLNEFKMVVRDSSAGLDYRSVLKGIFDDITGIEIVRDCIPVNEIELELVFKLMEVHYQAELEDAFSHMVADRFKTENFIYDLILCEYTRIIELLREKKVLLDKNIYNFKKEGFI